MLCRHCWLATPPERMPIGISGMDSAMLTASISSSATLLTASLIYKSLLNNTETDKLHPVVDVFGLKQFLTPSFPSHRNL